MTTMFRLFNRNRITFDPSRDSKAAFLSQHVVKEPYLSWIDLWCDTLIALKGRPHTGLTLFWDPPAPEDKISEVEKRMGQGVPAELRQTFLDFSSRFGMKWNVAYDTSDPAPHGYTLNEGGFREISLGEVRSLKQMFDDTIRVLEAENEPEYEPYLAFDRHAFPFYAIGNGDSLAIDVRTNQVILIGHNSGPDNYGQLLGGGFYDFMSKWSHLGCIGPSDFMLEPYWNETGLDLTKEASQQLRDWLFRQSKG